MFIVVCLEDRDNDLAVDYTLATRTVWSSREEAESYRRTISPSRQPLIVEGRFDQLRTPPQTFIMACSNAIGFKPYDTCRICGDLIGVPPQEACPEGFARCFCKRPIIAEKSEPWDTCFLCGGAVNLRGDCDPILCDCPQAILE